MHLEQQISDLKQKIQSLEDEFEREKKVMEGRNENLKKRSE